MSGLTFERTETQRANWSNLPSAVDSLWGLCLDKGSDVGRALTANVICVANKSEADALRNAVNQLHKNTPCRAFLLLLDPRAEGSAPHEQVADLSAATRRRNTVRDIVLEEIVIHLDPRDMQRMPGLLRPLIIDDLPSHLLWSLPWPADEAPFDTVGELCQHRIVDSRRFGNPARELLAVKQRQDRSQALTDLSWLRIQPWRRALAEAFERFEWQPGTAVRGVVRYGKQARASAMLLSDWLHERLAAAIEMEPDGSGDSIGPDHVSLQVGEIEIVVELVHDKLRTHVSTASHCYLPFGASAVRGNDAELLAIAIDQG